MRAPARTAAKALFDLVAVALLVSLLWIPQLSDFAGAVFVTEIFFHWDHFVMAPALAWRHGMALGGDVYSQYGVGWPLLLNAISGVVPLKHQNVLGLGIFYGTLVFVGLYGLLVVLVRSRPMALAAVLFALWLGPFAPAVAERPLGVIWIWPSLTVLRAPMEVWFFLALLLHARGGRPATAIVTGLLVGLALLLETDTGIFLAATWAAYGLCIAIAPALGARGAPAPRLGVGAAAAATALLVSALGLAVSSRGALLREPVAFLGDFLGGVTNSSALGVGALPFNWFLLHYAEALPWALATLASGLLAAAWLGVRLLHGRLDPTSLFAGCVGLYAVARCTLFVWSTNPIRLTLVAIPLALLAAVALAELRRPVADALGRALRSRAALLDQALPLAALALAGSLLLASPTLAGYPNAWSPLEGSDDDTRIALFPKRGEITGLDPEDRTRLRVIRALILEVRRRSLRGERVAVVDPIKTLVFLEAGAPPWRGSPSWFANTWTQDEVARLAATLGPAGPDTVIIRGRSPAPHVEDVWAVLHDTVARHYVLGRRIGSFEVWVRPGREEVEESAGPEARITPRPRPPSA